MDRAITVFEQLVDSSVDDDAQHQPVGEPVPLSQLRAAVAGTFDVYSRLFLQTFDLYEDLVLQAVGSPGQTLQDASLVLTGSPGEEAFVKLWIHNTTDADVGDVAAWMTTLTSHDGAEIPACSGAVTCSAPAVPAGTSCEAQLIVKVPMSTVSGVYHGNVLVTGLPSASLPVRAVVTT